MNRQPRNHHVETGVTLHGFVLHGRDVFEAGRRNVPVPAGPFLPRPSWRVAARAKKRHEETNIRGLLSGQLARSTSLLCVHLCFLWSLEELRRSRLLRSRLRLRFSRLRLPRSLLQLRCFSPRLGGELLRLRFLCRSLSRSVESKHKDTERHKNAS